MIYSPKKLYIFLENQLRKEELHCVTLLAEKVNQAISNKVLGFMAEKEKSVMNVFQLLKGKELDKEPVPIALNANLFFKLFL